MKILAIDTSCDETSVAVTEGRRVLSNIIYSQTLIHNKWGGVFPSLAKRAHEERIDFVVEEALRKSQTSWPEANRPLDEDLRPQIDYIAVTQGPGLAIALEVGIRKAKELAEQYGKKLIAVNHMEGHLYSPFVQNSKGSPDVEIKFPYLVLLVSGAHTELVVFTDHLKYEVIGKKLDDAAGEALDKGARMLGLGYPGGAPLERLAAEVNNEDMYKFPRPMARSNDLNFSYSGLKTSLLYKLRDMPEEEKAKNIRHIASSYQAAIFDTLIMKTESAIKKTGIKNLLVGGGVAANKRLRLMMRVLARKQSGSVLFPHYSYLNGDNAAMIGVVARYKAEQNQFISDPSSLDRIPRLSL
jgi:N6-L-threonylcarbamoyladenine synthase